LLARHLPDTALFLLDHNLRILVAEGQALTANNYSPSDLEGKLITEVLTSDTSGQLVSQYRESIEHAEELIRTYEWEVGDFEIHTLPVRNQRGKVAYLMVVANDITQRRANERALIDAERRSRALLDALPDAMFVVNRDWIIVEAHAHPSITWPIRAENVGQTIHELGLSQVAIQRLMNALNRAIETRQPQTHEYVLNVLQKDAYFEGRTVVVNEDQTLTVIRDITELRLTTRRLTERTTDLEMLRSFEHDLNRSLNVHSIMNRFTEYLLTAGHATHAAAYLLSGETFTLSHARGVSILQPADQWQAILSELKTTAYPVQRDYEISPAALRTSNRCYVLAMPIMTMEQWIGAILLEAVTPFTPRQIATIEQMMMRAAAVLQNAQLYELVESQLREMQQLYSKVRRLEQIKTDMIRVASHDLKSPLTGMRGYLQLLRQDAEAALTPEQLGYLDEIAHAADRMQHMIDGILSLDRIQQMADDALHEVINLRQVAARIVRDHAGSARQCGVQLSAELAEGPDARVEGDVFQIQEAIANLLSNALKYTPAGGRVTVSVRVEGPEAILTVQDTGYGIPEAMQQQLFTAFYRAPTQESRHIEGTGLGLHLVKNIVERHHGRILFHSEYSKGSTFGFALPLHTEGA
jgi:signal transduction histidine kinase/PAS domain-containing protein